MSIEVHEFNVKEAEMVLKTCPNLVQEYVKLLKRTLENQQDLTRTAITKIRELSKQLKS